MKIGIIGMGHAGMRHANTILGIGMDEVMGFDISPRMDNFAFPIECDRQAFWDWKPNAVIIATPPHCHTIAALDAIDHGCHLFIEKPLAASLDEAQMIAENCQKHGLYLQCGYNLRFNRSMLSLKQKVDQIPGMIFHRSTLLVNMHSWPSPTYRRNLLLDAASHEIDLACFLMGKMTKVFAAADISSLRIIFESERGAGSILVASRAAESRHLDVAGHIWNFDKRENDQAYIDEIQNFIAAAEGSNREQAAMMHNDGVDASRMISAVQKSIAGQNQMVTL